ncbi:helix-turn-helix domain-containing protein [Streptomyces sp. NPDC008139]|uniref:helix-turn-helix domain-containing protein n=1 Tax=Streptomyces sp. NPDC008139 TaxID=3364814 RepID=UPI0036E85DFF
MSENLKRLRKARGLTTTALAAALADDEIEHPIPASGITRIEKGDRRVDVDDLVALAVALNVSPLTLLLPDSIGEELVHLSRGYAVPARIAWSWAEGQRTALDWDGGEGTSFAGPGVDHAVAAEAYEREQRFDRLQYEYQQLARPEGRRRADSHPTVRLIRNLGEVVEDLVLPEPDADRATLAARGRMAQRRHAQVELDLEEIIEQLPPVHPGVPLADDAGGDQA